MAAQKFGKTWWGSEWLKSLTHIDYANRIPRGSAYVRKGAVKSINVKGNVITAKVSGSRPTPYRVTIRVYRIGQHQNVIVHRFITQNTFEERIDQMIQDTRHLADMTVASGESWIGKLSNSELMVIFG